MKQIPLSRGLFATVDDEDFDFLSRWKWSASPQGKTLAGLKYRAVRMAKRGEPNVGKMVLMHRLVSGAPEGMVVDHINGDPLDNRRCNLRVCTQSENCLNSRPHSDSQSRFKGVTFHKPRDCWTARFRNRHLGLFTTEEQAAAAYDTAAKNHNAEFALTNRELEEA